MSVSPDIYAARPGHAPVMLREVMAAMALHDGAIVVDATFGGGGYSRAFLEAAACTVYGVDRDADAIARAAPLLAEFPGRLHMLQGPFSELVDLLAAGGVHAAHAVVFDLGVSSYQIDTAARGFSFGKDGPLDMRMGQDGPTAADIVRETSAEELARILWTLGEERQSRRIAKAIVAARAERPIETTAQLAGIIEGAIGRRPTDKIHPATRSFQGLRIYVNDELGELEKGLDAAERLLLPGGRLVVVSFHSLEDRIVKQFMRERSGEVPGISRHMPVGGAVALAPTFTLLSRKVGHPGDDEVAVNARARSARLRAASRNEAPARNQGVAA